MRTVKEVDSALKTEQIAHDAAVKEYRSALLLLKDREDVLIASRERLSRLKDEYTEVHYKEQTLVEAEEEFEENEQFRSRLGIVMQRLEEAGSAKIKDPVRDWVRENPEKAQAVKDCWVALAYYKGILISDRDKDRFSIKLKNLDAGMKDIVKVFFMGDVLKG